MVENGGTSCTVLLCVCMHLVADPGVVRLIRSNPPDPKPTMSNIFQ